MCVWAPCTAIKVCPLSGKKAFSSFSYSSFSSPPSSFSSLLCSFPHLLLCHLSSRLPLLRRSHLFGPSSFSVCFFSLILLPCFPLSRHYRLCCLRCPLHHPPCSLPCHCLLWYYHLFHHPLPLCSHLRRHISHCRLLLFLPSFFSSFSSLSSSSPPPPPPPPLLSTWHPTPPQSNTLPSLWLDPPAFILYRWPCKGAQSTPAMWCWCKNWRGRDEWAPDIHTFLCVVIKP